MWYWNKEIDDGIEMSANETSKVLQSAENS